MTTIYQIAGKMINKGNKKDIYNELYLTVNGQHGEVADTIAQFIQDCSTTFVSDIAKKYDSGYSSEKQVWCMVFEAKKISHMYEAWVENELNK